MIDPLGGINTLWPLFGISNQMLAAIALTLCTVVIFKMKRERYAWVTIVPTAWLLICTLTAGLREAVPPESGDRLHRPRQQVQRRRGGKVLAPAKSVAEMQRVVFNDWVDAALCALFVLVVVAMIFYGVAWIRRAWPPRPSPRARSAARPACGAAT